MKFCAVKLCGSNLTISLTDDIININIYEGVTAMAEHRIYNDKFDINTQNTMDFYNARAKRANEMECPYTAVLLGDSSPKHAEEMYQHDKENLLPLLRKDDYILTVIRAIPSCTFRRRELL